MRRSFKYLDHPTFPLLSQRTWHKSIRIWSPYKKKKKEIIALENNTYFQANCRPKTFRLSRKIVNAEATYPSPQKEKRGYD